MRILVAGAGAVGSVMGALLAEAGHDVDLVGRKEHVEAIQARGLAVHGQRPLRAKPRATTSVPAGAAHDITIVAVKAYDLAEALATVPRGGVVLTIQNGLGNWERARAALPGATVLGASLIVAATLERPGEVGWNGVLNVTLGGERAAAERLAATLEGAGMRCVVTDDLASAVWTKAIINATLTPLAAITRKTHGEMLDDPACLARLKAICAEATEVARAEGVRLPEADPWAAVERLASATRNHKSSMLQSLERGRPTEIEAITGEIVRAGERHGLPCPENRRVRDELLRR